MSAYSDRYRNIAGTFDERVRAVPAGAWDNPAPCDGWVARDIIRHLVEWIPGFFTARAAGIEFPDGPSVDDDPVGAWAGLHRTLQAAFDDPAVAQREIDTGFGTDTVEATIDGYCTGDIFMHTWDLARATGLDETLDVDECRRMLEQSEPLDEAMRKSGHFGPRVEVPDDADVQTRLIAFIGRTP